MFLDLRKNETIIILISVIAILLAIMICFQQYQIIQIEQQNGELASSLKTYECNTAIVWTNVDNQETRIDNLESQVDILEYNKIDFYAYGDSITRATGVEGLNPDGSDSYISQMTREFLPGSIALHNFDGGGMDSQWGAANIKYHYSRNMRFFIYMFTNDGETNLTANQTIDDYLTIYNFVKQNGTIPIPCIPILTKRSGYLSYTLENQTASIQSLESALDSRSIFYVKMYDALDSIPDNGQFDAINITYLPDGIHPNKTGQQLMAGYLWNAISQRYNISSLDQMNTKS